MKQCSYIIKLASLAVLLFNFSFVKAELQCPDPSKQLNTSIFATKTGYEAAVKDGSLNEKLDKEVASNQCKVQQVWLLSRHGARYPVKADIKRMGAVLPLIAQELFFNNKEGKGCFSESQAKELETFVLPYSIKDGGQLTEAGGDEQHNLGVFWRNKFPEIFGDKYSDSLFKVEYTTTNRTAQSAYHFLRGMFGDDAVARIKLPKPRKPNFKLRPYKSCPVWSRDVENNEDTYKLQRMYETTEEYLKTLEDVSRRLGYDEDLPKDELQMIYDECRFETAWWHDIPSVWCAAFTDHDLKVLQYHQALKHYYENSYGGPPLNAQLGCTAAADLYKQFQKAVEGASDAYKGVLYFSHDKTILQFFTSLGLFKPKEDLEHDNRIEIENEDVFSISKIAPFSNNVGFALYKCEGDTHRVAAFHQGNAIKLPSDLCNNDKDSVSCSWPLNKLPESSEECNIKKLCNDHDEL